MAAGDPLVVLEAMKMEHRVTSPAAGTVAEVRVKAGQTVDGDEVLVVVSDDVTSDARGSGSPRDG